MRTVVYVNSVHNGWLARIASWAGYQIVKVTFQNATTEVVLWKITKLDKNDLFSELTCLIGPAQPGFVQVTGIEHTSFVNARHKLDAHWFAQGGVL